MSDQESSAFKVVDRRHAASPEEPTENAAAPAPDSAAPTETPEPSREEAPSDSEMPEMEPAFFLSYAAMQMDTRQMAEALLAIFDSHAWRGLGLLSDARFGATHQDLPSAQLAIDCFRALLEKIGGGMEPDELREAQRRLNDLQMNYLARLRES